jgi:hypothetical protein
MWCLAQSFANPLSDIPNLAEIVETGSVQARLNSSMRFMALLLNELNQVCLVVSNQATDFHERDSHPVRAPPLGKCAHCYPKETCCFCRSHETAVMLFD